VSVKIVPVSSFASSVIPKSELVLVTLDLSSPPRANPSLETYHCTVA